MRDNLVALNEIVSLTVAGKLKEAGDVAEKKRGTSVMGQHREKALAALPTLNSACLGCHLAFRIR
jgi:hypothetical protein